MTGMSPEQFKTWRRNLKLKQREAAEKLGLKKRMIQYYEKGNRAGKPVEIPKAVRLACYAIARGVDDFDGEATISDDPPSPLSDKAARANSASSHKGSADL